MTVLWLIVWLVSNTPQVQFKGEPIAEWNNWAIALAVCLVIDLIGAIRS